MPTKANFPKVLPLTKSDEPATYPIDGRLSVSREVAQSAKHREPPLNEIRELVAMTLKRLGLGKAKLLGERLVGSEGSYVGIRFTYDCVSAVWLGEHGHIRFVDDAGQLLEIVRLKSCRDVAKKAA